MSVLSSTDTNTTSQVLASRRWAWPRWTHWIPALALATGVLLVAREWSPALAAWALALALYIGFKWLTLASSRAAQSASKLLVLGYLFLWPGMDADAFFTRRALARPTWRETLFAWLQLGLGMLIVVSIPRLEPLLPTWLAGWLGLFGLALALLFGLARVVSIWWRQQGIDAQPIMRTPVLARSLTEFWGGCWNLAFHDVGRLHVLQPLFRRVGPAPAIVAVFLFSGIVHDLVMSIPVRAGLGLPTLYFVIQCIGVLLERSTVGKRWGLGRGIVGRVYAALVVLLPAGLLFHEPFLRGVILPTLDWLAA